MNTIEIGQNLSGTLIAVAFIVMGGYVVREWFR